MATVARTGTTMTSQVNANKTQQATVNKLHSDRLNSLQNAVNLVNAGLSVDGISKNVTTTTGLTVATDLTVQGQVLSPNNQTLYGYSGDGAYPVTGLTVTTPGGANVAWYDDVASQLNAVIGVMNYLYSVIVDTGILDS